MFPDYEKLVLEDYRRKKADNKLALALSFPTPAKLKAECERVCTERFQRKDEQAIRDFFGKSGDQKDCLQAIQRCEIDKFRPLIKFLNGDGTTKTDTKNIQLLAWLIDFHDRPFELGKKYGLNTTEEQEIRPKEPVDIIQVKSQSFFERQSEVGEKEEVDNIHKAPGLIDRLKFKRISKKILTTSVLILFIGAAAFWWWNIKSSTVISTNNEECMYWAFDHYELVPCSKKMDNTLVIALDTAKVRLFRKITIPDTITLKSEGLVWYSKIDGTIEYFTADGYHPVKINHRLKPLSDYMIKKYILYKVISQ